MPSLFQRPEAVVRAVFAAATVLFGVLGLLLGEGRLLIAAGLCGTLWTLWDVIWGRVVGPFGTWAFRSLSEGPDGPLAIDRPTLDDTVRLLESHLEHRAGRHVEIQSALRLEEIYRTVRKDPARARAVLERVRERYPDAPELEKRAALENGQA
jgi:hypothetical protein